MINVLALYSDNGFLGDYRVRLPAKAVTDRRHQTGMVVETAGNLGIDAVRDGDDIKINNVYIPSGINVLSIPRPTKLGTANIVAWLRTHRPDVGIVVDLDDEMGDQTGNPHLKRAVALADSVTCSTQALADIYSYDDARTFVIRNAVPVDALDFPSNPLSRRSSKSELHKDRMVGWSGDPQTYRTDLESMQGALANVVGADRTDGRRVRMRNIGRSEGLAEALSLNLRDVEASGVLPANLVRVALGEIDVAVCPSADEDAGFTRALEFAAAGVPVIASRTFEHEELTHQGMPVWLVANKKREWTRALQAVLSFDDRELRDVAHAHRENVRQFHTIDRRTLNWAAAYRTAYNITKE